ncbi:putative coiled-coil protein SlyX [Paenibacillus sp. V4I9]|uniref:DUF6022 family protein n=1 Tax=Paenibacillus sp. V4I9 TaxID=3042308 RepID=UPI00278A4937|nr:DUF6022 family protein [Paenibacillus sp. V4I9]MDQ0885857.1 putative coiled-coil protein SlyX [Paenibacillus sp. V4I9]
MKAWKEYFETNQEITIQSLAAYVNQHIQQMWVSVLQDHYDELTDTFEKIGEPSYGVYIHKLLQPILKEVTNAGYNLKPGFKMPHSLEHWGPPEERERCMWCVVKDEHEKPVGTFVLRVFHSHVKFKVPLAPNILALDETEQDSIIAAISKANIRLNKEYGGVVHQNRENDQIQRWDYSAETGLSDYLTQNETEVSVLDYALSKWGKEGWELASVVPHQGRLIAFFKRPAS